jgi:hypothetical protein
VDQPVLASQDILHVEPDLLDKPSGVANESGNSAASGSPSNPRQHADVSVDFKPNIGLNSAAISNAA